MSLKFNPFDQRAKGSLVKRRKVFEAPPSNSTIEPNAVNIEAEPPDSSSATNINSSVTTSTKQLEVSSESIEGRLEVDKDLNEGQLGVKRESNHLSTSNQPLINKICNSGQLEVDKGLLKSQLEVALEADLQLTSNSKPLIDLQLTSNQPLIHFTKIEELSKTIKRSIRGQTGVASGPIDGQLEVTKFLRSELPLWSELGSAQGAVILFLYQHCDFTTLKTRSVKKTEVSKICGIAESSVGSTFKKLVKLGLIVRLEGKRGEDGYTRFQFDKAVYAKMKSDGADQKKINSGSIGGHLEVALEVNKESDTSSMYVGINNNTIHTEPPIQHLPDEWADLRDIDFATLAPWNIKSSVVETFKKNKWLVTREQLEDFIERFIRYFTEAEFEARRSSIRSPYSLFLNSVKALSQGEPDPICDVKTQFDLQREIAIKNKQKQLEENKRRFDALEKSLDQCRESEFETWLAKLTLEEQSRLVPPKAMAQVGSIAYRQLLKAYYTEMIWPQFKQTILNGPRA